MVLDDLPPFIRSHAFADDVHAAMGETALTVDEIQAALDGSRYSRVLTVYITSEDKQEVEEIAAAAESALPDSINGYLMPEDAGVATVRIIDPPSAPSRDRDGHWLQLLITAALGVLIGGLIAIAVGSRDRPEVQPSTRGEVVGQVRFGAKRVQVEADELDWIVTGSTARATSRYQVREILRKRFSGCFYIGGL
ncbi:MAG: hypothetical protein R2848_08895 [Thermomicrobiales bacterium]